MSFHKNPKYQIPALIEALKAHGLDHDRPSQLSDAFRIGWLAAIAQPVQPVQPAPSEQGDAKDAERFVAFFTAALSEDQGDMFVDAFTSGDPKTLDDIRAGIDAAILASKGEPT